MKEVKLSYNNTTRVLTLAHNEYKWELKGTIDEILTPHRKDGKVYMGLADEAILEFGEDIVIDATSLNTDAFEKVYAAFGEEDVKVFGKTGVYIEYSDNPVHTSIFIHYPHMSKPFHTPSDDKLTIEAWVSKGTVFHEWPGIYKALENEIGTDRFTIYFKGDRKYMKTLLFAEEIKGMKVDVFAYSNYTPSNRCDVVEDETISHTDYASFESNEYEDRTFLGWDSAVEKQKIEDRYKSTNQAIGNMSIPQGKWKKIEDGINNKDIPNDYTIVSTQAMLVENIDRLESLKSSWMSDSGLPKDPKYGERDVKRELNKRKGRFSLYLGRLEKLRDKKKEILGGAVGYISVLILLYILSMALAKVGNGGVSTILLTFVTVITSVTGPIIGISVTVGFWYIIYSTFRHHYRPLDYADGCAKREEIIREFEEEYGQVLPIYRSLLENYESKKAECIKKIDNKLVDYRAKIKALESKFPVVPKNYRDSQSLSYIANVLETNRVSVSGAIHMYQEELTRIAEEEAYDRMARAAESEARSRKFRESVKDGVGMYTQLSTARSAKRLSKAYDRSHK